LIGEENPALSNSSEKGGKGVLREFSSEKPFRVQGADNSVNPIRVVFV